MQNRSTTHKSKIEINSIQKLARRNMQRLILESEWEYHSKIDLIAKKIAKSNKIKIVFVSGPSASGKTTSANFLKTQLKYYGINAIVCSLDNFFMDRDKCKRDANGIVDIESPDVVDIDFFKQTVDNLLINKVAKFPRFDFAAQKSIKDFETINLKDDSILIIEGIHALNPKFYDDIIAKNCLKVYVCPNRNFAYKGRVVFTTNNLRLLRRMSRDSISRGSTMEETLQMWDNVNKGAEKYIKPFKKDANYIVDTTHKFEPFLYKHTILPKLQKMKTTNETIKKIINALEKCEFELTEKELPKNSLIHEFLGRE